MKKKQMPIKVGDTMQLHVNNQTVNGYWAGSRGLLLERKYALPPYKNKLYINQDVLKKLLKVFGDFRISLANPRLVLMEKVIFNKTDFKSEGKKDI